MTRLPLRRAGRPIFISMCEWGNTTSPGSERRKSDIPCGPPVTVNVDWPLLDVESGHPLFCILSRPGLQFQRRYASPPSPGPVSHQARKKRAISLTSKRILYLRSRRQIKPEAVFGQIKYDGGFRLNTTA